MKYTTRSMVQSMIKSRLDYCDTFYINLPDEHHFHFKRQLLTQTYRMIPAHHHSSYPFPLTTNPKEDTIQYPRQCVQSQTRTLAFVH